mgnify:CR=1 FL=1
MMQYIFFVSSTYDLKALIKESLLEDTGGIRKQNLCLYLYTHIYLFIYMYIYGYTYEFLFHAIFSLWHMLYAMGVQS